jgi:ribosomal protein L37AE/L43A
MSIESRGQALLERRERDLNPALRGRCLCPKCGHKKARKKAKGWFCRKCGLYLGLELEPVVVEGEVVGKSPGFFARLRATVGL